MVYTCKDCGRLDGKGQTILGWFSPEHPDLKK